MGEMSEAQRLLRVAWVGEPGCYSETRWKSVEQSYRCEPQDGPTGWRKAASEGEAGQQISVQFLPQISRKDKGRYLRREEPTAGLVASLGTYIRSYEDSPPCPWQWPSRKEWSWMKCPLFELAFGRRGLGK